MDLNGGLCCLSREELADLYQYKTPPFRLTSNYWHPEGPSTWMTVAVFNLARRKYPKLTEKEHLMVAGHTLRIDWKEVVRLIRWHESYIAIHEGGGEYEVLEGRYGDDRRMERPIQRDSP